MDDKVVLCASSAYSKKYYFNEEFNSLPDTVKKELQIMCVTYTEDIGGILTVEFSETGELELTTSADEMDLLYDEIGSVLKIKQIRQQKEELFEALEMFFKVFYCNE
jgi:hypothetical protein